MRQLILLLFPLLTTGCAVIKDTVRPNLNKLDYTNYKNLNGSYLNYGTDTVNVELSFWYQINKYKKSELSKNWTGQTVTIDFISRKKVQLTLYEKGIQIDKKTIKGTIKDGYFYKRPFFVPFPLIPILFGYTTHRSRFGLVDKRLFLDKKEHYWVCSFGFGSTKKHQILGIYERR